MKKLCIIIPILLIFFISCKKEVEPEVKPNDLIEINKEDISKIEKHFNDKNYSTQINKVINDSISVFWKPNWNESSLEKSGDSIKYIYVPLNPTATNIKTNKNTKAKFSGVLKYLAVRIEENNKYFLAEYVSSEASPDVALSNFTGTASLRNLDDNSVSFSRFKNGKREANVSQGNLRTQACVIYYTCDWYSYDCGVDITTTRGANMCQYPPYSPFSCAGSGRNGTWNVSSSNSGEPVCNDDPVIVLPSPGSAFAIHYVFTGPEKPISNLSERLNCFTTQSQYQPNLRYTNSVTFYIDQPVENSNQLYKTSGSRKPGHAFIELTQTIKENRTSSAATTKTLVFGFYVKSELKAALGKKTAGAWGDDGDTPYDVALTYQVGGDSFDKVLKYFRDAGTPEYDIVDNNCTTMGYNALNDIFKVIGGLPAGEQEIAIYGIGKTPAQMAQDIRAKFGNDRHFRTSNGQNSPKSWGCPQP